MSLLFICSDYQDTYHVINLRHAVRICLIIALTSVSTFLLVRSSKLYVYYNLL